MSKLLEVRKLCASYGATQVLFDVDFSLEKGHITAILGANGAGKTTTLRALCQVVRTSGSVTLDGTQLVGKSTEAVVRMGVAHVPDGRGTFTGLTVEENLRLGAYARGNKAEMMEDMERMFTRFPILKQRRHQQAGTLSGGEQQMLAITYNDDAETYEIESREFPKIKERLLFSLTNRGRPLIAVREANYKNRGELYLEHDYNGVELQMDYARDTLVNLQRLWRRPVHIESVLDGKLAVLSYDGTEHNLEHSKTPADLATA